MLAKIGWFRLSQNQVNIQKTSRLIKSKTCLEIKFDFHICTTFHVAYVIL